MKSFFFSALTICLISLTGFSQSACSKYYPLEEGTTFQYTNYDKKGKMTGSIDYTTTNYRKEAGLEIITMKVNTKDKKGEETVDFYYDISCDGTGISIDFKSLGNMGMLQQFEDMETEVTGTNVIIPNNLSVGQKLPDSEMKMKISMASISMNVDVITKDRKVISEEKMSTPAGSYDCLVLQSTTESNVLGKKMSYTTSSWIAEGVGMVKQESFDDKGNLMNSSELTKFEN